LDILLELVDFRALRPMMMLAAPCKLRTPNLFAARSMSIELMPASQFLFSSLGLDVLVKKIGVACRHTTAT